MNKLIKVLLSVSMLGLVFVSCQKDAVTATTKNAIKYDGKEYDLTGAYLVNYGQDESDEGYNIDLSLHSSGIKLYETKGDLDSLSGTGTLVYFELFSKSATRLETGEYKFDSTSTWNAGTFDDAALGIDFNVKTYKGTVVNITAGKVTVKNTATEYEITINCTTASNKPLTGYYKGTYKFYDYSAINQALSFTNKKSSQKILLPLQARQR